MILPEVRGSRFVTTAEAGTLTDDDHRLLAVWVATRAEHVLPQSRRCRWAHILSDPDNDSGAVRPRSSGSL